MEQMKTHAYVKLTGTVVTVVTLVAALGAPQKW